MPSFGRRWPGGPGAASPRTRRAGAHRPLPSSRPRCESSSAWSSLPRVNRPSTRLAGGKYRSERNADALPANPQKGSFSRVGNSLIDRAADDQKSSFVELAGTWTSAAGRTTITRSGPSVIDGAAAGAAGFVTANDRGCHGNEGRVRQRRDRKFVWESGTFDTSVADTAGKRSVNGLVLPRHRATRWAVGLSARPARIRQPSVA